MAKQVSNRINPKKLILSKWTSLSPKQHEKHFLVIRTGTNENGTIVSCTLEAVLTRAEFTIPWQELKDTFRWRPGWDSVEKQ